MILKTWNMHLSTKLLKFTREVKVLRQIVTIIFYYLLD